MAVPWVRFTENALVPKIMLQFQNGDTSWHQGDSAGIFMYSAGIFETFVKKILCPRASPMCSEQYLAGLTFSPKCEIYVFIPWGITAFPCMCGSGNTTRNKKLS